MKKMTAKEFKEILTEANYDFDIYGYEGLLNVISIYSEMMAKKYDGTSAGKVFNKSSNLIFRALEERGYYAE